MDTQDGWMQLGRKRQRVTTYVYARDAHKGCYFCGGHVDQDLPPTHPQGRTAHHIIELQDGGDMLDPDNMALAHRDCNSEAGAKRQAAIKAQAKLSAQTLHVDPATL